MAARLWNKAPFVRLLTALAVGVLWQWYLPLPALAWCIAFGSSLLVVVAYSFTGFVPPKEAAPLIARAYKQAKQKPAKAKPKQGATIIAQH